MSMLTIRSDEKPFGWPCKRSNVTTNSPATYRTAKQNAACRATRARIQRARECGLSPPLSTSAGRIAEARSAGATPKSKLTKRVRTAAHASVRPPIVRERRAGSSGGLTLARTSGADHCAKHQPTAEATIPMIAASTKTSWRRRHRLAPRETRSAISRLLAAACAVIRLATFAQAISSTSRTSPPRVASEAR
jgi:hypothetical protein